MDIHDDEILTTEQLATRRAALAAARASYDAALLAALADHNALGVALVKLDDLAADLRASREALAALLASREGVISAMFLGRETIVDSETAYRAAVADLAAALAGHDALGAVLAGLDDLGAALAGHDDLGTVLARDELVAESSTRFLFGDPSDAVAEKLLSALRDAPGGLTRTQIHTKVFGSNYKADAIKTRLGTLLTGGMVYKRSVTTGKGRPAEVWFAGELRRRPPCRAGGSQRPRGGAGETR